nr:sigma factor [uncultured Dethiosulfovibrio sp.]
MSTGYTVESNGMDRSTVSFYRFAPLVRSVARRYAGRGADLDDLISQASCDVLELILSCPDDKSMALHLSQNLPGKVRDAAAKLRRQADHGSIEELSDSGYEPEDLLYGLTQAEIAKDLVCSQQNVSHMIKKLRTKL